MSNVNLIVIPIYNEFYNLKKLLPKLHPWNNLPGNKVVIVNDGSVDKSEALAKKIGFEVIPSSSGKFKTQRNLGKSRSFQKGVEYAVKNNFQHIATFDADLIKLRTNKSYISRSDLEALSTKTSPKEFVKDLNYVFDELKSKNADMLVLKQFEKNIYLEQEFCGQRVFRVSALKPFLFNKKWKLVAHRGFGLEHALDYLFLTTGRKIVNSDAIAITGPFRGGDKQYKDLKLSRAMIQARELFFYKKLIEYSIRIRENNSLRANKVIKFLKERENRFVSSKQGINSYVRVFPSSLDPYAVYKKQEKVWKNLYERKSSSKLKQKSKSVSTERRRKK